MPRTATQAVTMHMHQHRSRAISISLSAYLTSRVLRNAHAYASPICAATSAAKSSVFFSMPSPRL